MRKTLIGIVLVASVGLIALGSQRMSRLDSDVQAPSDEVGVPTFVLEPSWAKVPARWRLGSVSTPAADAQDHIWIIHRPGSLPADLRADAAPPVLEFDNDGNFIQAWGGEGEGYEFPRSQHGIHVDHNDHVWVMGTDHVILKFTRAGEFVLQIGRRGQAGDNESRELLNRPAGLQVFPPTNELFVADGYGNSRVVVFDAETGEYRRHWGAYGKQPEDLAAPSIDPNDPTVLFPWRRGYAETLQQFNEIHDLAVSSDGLVYAADRGNNRIQVFTVDGTFVAQQFVGIDRIDGPRSDLQARSVAFSADPAQTFLYVAGNPEIFILDRKTLEILDSFVTGDVERAHPPNHQIATDSIGNIYTASTDRGVEFADSILIYKWAVSGGVNGRLGGSQ